MNKFKSFGRFYRQNQTDGIYNPVNRRHTNTNDVAGKNTEINLVPKCHQTTHGIRAFEDLKNMNSGTKHIIRAQAEKLVKQFNSNLPEEDEVKTFKSTGISMSNHPHPAKRNKVYILKK